MGYALLLLLLLLLLLQGQLGDGWLWQERDNDVRDKSA
jgi:hypothetical protein